GRDQFDRLYRDGARAPRVMAISIHPYLTGVPHRIKYLEQLYDYILGHDGVVHWTGGGTSAGYKDRTARRVGRGGGAGAAGVAPGRRRLAPAGIDESGEGCMRRPRVLLVSLGGTITMTREAAGSGVVPTLGAAELVEAVPALADVADVVAHSALRIPSASLTFDDLIHLAALLEARLGNDVDGAVVIQGTDTIEETAWFLDLMIASDAPVVVTGARRGAQMPGAGGPANLLASTIVAASEAARGLGALAVLNDEVHAARFVQKSHSALPSAF